MFCSAQATVSPDSDVGRGLKRPGGREQLLRQLVSPERDVQRGLKLAKDRRFCGPEPDSPDRAVDLGLKQNCLNRVGQQVESRQTAMSSAD